jgi:hypothetical protein
MLNVIMLSVLMLNVAVPEAYSAKSLITAVKSFIVQTPREESFQRDCLIYICREKLLFFKKPFFSVPHHLVENHLTDNH